MGPILRLGSRSRWAPGLRAPSPGGPNQLSVVAAFRTLAAPLTATGNGSAVGLWMGLCGFDLDTSLAEHRRNLPLWDGLRNKEALHLVAAQQVQHACRLFGLDTLGDDLESQ